MHATRSDYLGEPFTIGKNDKLQFYKKGYITIETRDSAGRIVFMYGVVCPTTGERYLIGPLGEHLRRQAEADLEDFRRFLPTAAAAAEHLKRCRSERCVARQQQEQLACLQQQQRQLACWHGILRLEQQLRTPARRIPAPLQPPPPPGKHQEERCRPHSPDSDGTSF